MDLNLLQEEHDKLLAKVCKMRSSQIEYFKYRSSLSLQKAKRYEREVDDIIRLKVQEEQSPQQNLFDQ